VLYTRTSTYRNEVNFFASTLQNQKSPSKKCANAYTYGFNGKENDNEPLNDGNLIDFGSRVYDSRLGRWLSMDPKYKDYANSSPYCALANNPVLFIDQIGENIVLYYEYSDGKRSVLLTVVTEEETEFTIYSNTIPEETRTGIEGALIDPLFSPLNIALGNFIGTTQNIDVWGEFSSDAKMISISGVGYFAIGVVQLELDLVSINKYSESEDAGKTFAYFTVGVGLGVSVTSGDPYAAFASGDLTLIKGNVDFKEENTKGADLDRTFFAGWTFQTAYSVALYSKSFVTSYGTDDEECFRGECTESDQIYTAEMRGVSVVGLINLFRGQVSASISRFGTYSILIDEVEFLRQEKPQSQTTTKQE